MTQAYDNHPVTPANHAALTPLSFLERTADIYPNREAVIYGEMRRSWAELRERCRRVASSLSGRGVARNVTVSVLAYNTPEMVELHFAVGMAGGVLNTINTRLDAGTVAYIIDHAETAVFIVDRELWPVLKAALGICEGRPDIVIIDDTSAKSAPDIPADGGKYEDLVDTGDPGFQTARLSGEDQAFTLNYTSGTTGRPKGVVHDHRAAYLMAMGTVASWSLPAHPRYLYTVPMFHCNGWGHAWTVTLLAGTIICLRGFSTETVFAHIADHAVTHFGGAPIVLNMLASAPEAQGLRFERLLHAMTAGAPPAPAVLAKMARMNVDVMHVYGLTETYGHIMQAAPQKAWEAEPDDLQAELKSRQGVRFAHTEATDVLDANGVRVPHDGETMGEIVIRGNTVMKGYLKDPDATRAAFTDDWFRSGDLGVVHPDGYIQLRDRAKDIIISGGENISSVEIETVLYRHSAVGEAAVVAMRDEMWGEVPCAFIELVGEASEDEIIEFCAKNMARFKLPKRVVFGALPKTATGKVQKKVLRERANAQD